MSHAAGGHQLGLTLALADLVDLFDEASIPTIW
jgi:hypothetical protein